MVPTDAELLAFLDETLPVEQCVAIEQQLRDSIPLRNRLAGLLACRDREGRSVGDIWQRHRLSCPSVSELSGWLLQVLEPARSEYLEFHLQVIGCRYCQASLDELQTAQEQAESGNASAHRRQRYFESSAGLLRVGREAADE